MTVIRYYRDRRPWDCRQVRSPSWSDVEAAMRRMDNYCFPIVQPNCTEYEDDEEISVGSYYWKGGAWCDPTYESHGAFMNAIMYDSDDGKEWSAALEIIRNNCG